MCRSVMSTPTMAAQIRINLTSMTRYIDFLIADQGKNSICQHPTVSERIDPAKRATMRDVKLQNRNICIW